MTYRLMSKPAQPQQCGTCRHWGQPIDEARRNAWCFHPELRPAMTHFHSCGMCKEYERRDND